MADQPGMEIPVTLNCSGGISLGAYMAGVFTELVKAASGGRAHGASGPPSLCIDSITGASAGAMTGLIAAWYLLSPTKQEELGRDQPEAPPDQVNRFYDAWVRRIDISRLTDYLPPGEGMAALAATIIERIADDLLPAETIDHRARPLAVLMTVTNLQGLFNRPDESSPSAASVSHAETRRFLFSPQLLSPAEVGRGHEQVQVWEKAKVSARMSGAFPVAFPPIPDTSSLTSINLKGLDRAQYERFRTEKPEGMEQICPDPPQQPFRHLRFHYTDGGVLDGLPIVRGIELLQQLNAATSDQDQDQDQNFLRFQQDWQQEHKLEEKRLFLYIKPTPVSRLSDDRRLTRAFFSMLQNGIAGLTYPKEEHDDIRLKQIRTINRQVQLKQLLRSEIADLPVDEQQKSKLLRRLDVAIPYRNVRLEQIDPLTIFLPPPGGDDAPASFSAMLLSQIETRLAHDPPRAGRLALEDLRALLVSDVDDPQRQASKILACDWLGAFGGFFNRAHREHDYLIGRLSALAWMWQANLIPADAMQTALEQLVRQLEQHYLLLRRRSGAGPITLLYLALITLHRVPVVLAHDAVMPWLRQPWAWSLLPVLVAVVLTVAVLQVLAGWPLLLGLAALLEVLLLNRSRRRWVLDVLKIPLLLASLVTAPVLLLFTLLVKLTGWILRPLHQRLRS